MSKPRVGDWVEVRSKEKILQTLDKRGRLEELPFMPQMFQYCGKRFQVYKRAHKTCDWVYTVKARRLPDGIHLDLRCDGEAYEGCQAGCLLYWKEAWLRPVNGPAEPGTGSEQIYDSVLPSSISPLPSLNSCTEADVLAGTRTNTADTSDDPIYTCQGTDVLRFTEPISRWNIGQYIEDYRSGNVTLSQLFGGFAYVGYRIFAGRRRLGGPFRWIYDKVQAFRGGAPFPSRPGTVPLGNPTPTNTLNLQPGELVRVKSYSEILSTLDINGKNRGLRFDAEMVPYCGGIYPVRSRLAKFIEEKTGKIETMKNACIILEGVTCQSRYSECRMFCPRSLYSWWHEVWLERVNKNAQEK